MKNGLTLWTRQNPFSEFLSMQRDLERFFESPKATAFAGAQLGKDWNPKAAVTEDDKTYRVRVDLPGVPKEGIKLDFQEGLLTVSGERKEEKASDKEAEHYSEVFFGSFTRQFTFPKGIDPESIIAKHENGVLTVELAKSIKSQARQISVR